MIPGRKDWGDDRNMPRRKPPTSPPTIVPASHFVFAVGFTRRIGHSNFSSLAPTRMTRTTFAGMGRMPSMGGVAHMPSMGGGMAHFGGMGMSRMGGFGKLR